jgi:signal peptide peptidase SppA
MKAYNHLATRLFGVPLLINRQKLDAVLAAVSTRFTGETDAAPKAYGPGDPARRKPYFVSADGVATIDIVGPLVKRNSGDFLSGGPTTYGEIEYEFTDAVTDPAVKGILLQVDSPGGECTGCFELASLIRSNRGSKPIIAAVDGDAFSAAYALASAADEVFILPSGGAGSIGVWMMHVDWSAANEKDGIKPTYIFAGAHKIDGNPDSPLSDSARATFEEIVAKSYDAFVQCVVDNRGMSADDVRATEAGLYFGEDAVAAGLADKTGTITQAMNAMLARIAQPTRSNMEQPNAAAEPVKPQAEPPKAEPTATFATARQIVEMCALAGLSARASLGFLRPDASVEDIRGEILEAKVEQAGSEIHSHIMPDAGTGASNDPAKSGIVKRAEAMAAAAKGGR